MGQLVKFRPCQVHIQMLGSLRGSRDEGQIDIGGGGRGQLLLCLLSRLFQSLKRHLVA